MEDGRDYRYGELASHAKNGGEVRRLLSRQDLRAGDNSLSMLRASQATHGLKLPTSAPEGCIPARCKITSLQFVDENGLLLQCHTQNDSLNTYLFECIRQCLACVFAYKFLATGHEVLAFWKLFQFLRLEDSKRQWGQRCNS